MKKLVSRFSIVFKWILLPFLDNKSILYNLLGSEVALLSILEQNSNCLDLF